MLSIPIDAKQDKKNISSKKVTNSKKLTKKKSSTIDLKKSSKKQLKKKPKKRKRKKRTDADRAKNIIKVLKFGMHKQRKEAIQRILRLKDKKVKTDLAHKLIDYLKLERHMGVKIKALNILSQLKIKKATPIVIKLVSDRSIDVKIAAVYALKSLEATNAKNLLIKEIKKQNFSENSNYTEALLNTLGTFKAKELASFAKKKIESTKTTKSLRSYLVIFLGKSGAIKSKKYLLKLYNDDDESKSIRAYAVNSLANLKIKDASPHIKKILDQIDTYSFKKKKKYYTLRIYSIAALARLGDKDASTRLLFALKSDNSYERLRAAKLLIELKDKRSIDILTYKVKYDPNKKVRKACEKALKAMGLDKKGKKIKKKTEKTDKITKSKKTKNTKKITEKKTKKKSIKKIIKKTINR